MQKTFDYVILGQTIRQHASGRAGADDDVIEGFLHASMIAFPSATHPALRFSHAPTDFLRLSFRAG
jgi:predicted short-subunit dehydrogenase-like oxidoreductase (DUF2520 family)